MPSYSDHQLRLAARLYYVDGLSQTEVSKYVNVSQAHVSRLLSLARERGIVRIFVDEYEPRNSQLEEELKKRFKLTSAAVVKTYKAITAENLRLTVGRFTAPFVAALIPDNAIVAISGGRTLRELINLLPPPTHGLQAVLQAMGNIDSNITSVDAQELGRVLAAHYKSPFFALNSPAYIMDKTSRDSLLQLDQIRGVRQRFNDVHVALVGIGNMEDSVFIERGVLTRNDLEKLKKAGVVGEVCGRFFDENGRECSSVWKNRVISIEMEQLRRIPNVIAVVTGEDRAHAVAAAIRGGIVKSVAVDEMAAEALLSEPEKTLPRKREKKS